MSIRARNENGPVWAAALVRMGAQLYSHNFSLWYSPHAGIESTNMGLTLTGNFSSPKKKKKTLNWDVFYFINHFWSITSHEG